MANTVKNYKVTISGVQAIQFSRNSLSVIYDFNDKRDVSCITKGGKTTGTFTSEKGVVIPVSYNDYIIKQPDGTMSAMNSTDFEAMYTEEK